MGANFGMPPPPVPQPGGMAQQPRNPFAPNNQPPVIGGGNEEEKKAEAPNAEGNANLPEGIDEEFFNSLPEEYKQELLRDNDLMRRNLGQPPAEPEPSREPDAMDTASFLASLTDESLRREILIGMDEPTMATLPEHVQAEGRRYQRELQRRQFRRDNDPQRLLRRMMERQGRDDRRDVNRYKAREEKYDQFLDLIKRREEK